jgi:hypothetical protein
MPKGPKGQKRPADVIGNAVHVMKIATGEVTEAVTHDARKVAAATLGRLGGLARAKALSKRERTTIARKAAKASWSKRKR